MSQRNSGSANSVKISDIQRYLQNPEAHMKEIRRTSMYLTNKHGVLRDAIRMIKSLPTLKYGLSWSIPDGEDISEHEEIVNKLLDDINVIDVVRDGLLEVAELGTVVMCLRSNKYVQFLELDDLKIDKQRNGKWVVEFDLKTLDEIRDLKDRVIKINSLPDEVSLAKYTRYKKSNSEELRYVEIKNCEIVNLDAKRNTPYGLPFHLGAWLPILQKEIIDQVERSVSDRLVKQILILSAGHMDKEGTKPVPKELIDYYFKEVDSLIKQKDGENYGQGGTDSSGTGVIAFPNMFELDALEVDTTFFTKDLYDKIEDDIYANLGISKALGFGEGGNYSSATVNSEKLFSVVFSLVGQFETAINEFLKGMFKNTDIVCKVKFDKSTVMDKQAEIDSRYELYLQTSWITPWMEAVMDAPIADIIEMRQREINMKLDEIFFPAQNAHTTSGDKAGRPTKKDNEIDNDNTAGSRNSGGNNNPSPSD